MVSYLRLVCCPIACRKAQSRLRAAVFHQEIAPVELRPAGLQDTVVFQRSRHMTQPVLASMQKMGKGAQATHTQAMRTHTHCLSICACPHGVVGTRRVTALQPASPGLQMPLFDVSLFGIHRPVAYLRLGPHFVLPSARLFGRQPLLAEAAHTQNEALAYERANLT